MSPGDTINNFSIALATDLSKALVGLSTLALVIVAMTLVLNLGGNNLQKVIRGNLLSIGVGIMVGYGAAGLVAFIAASAA